MTPDFALACWERAAEAEFGLVLTCADEQHKREVEKLLYTTRQASKNPTLDELMIARPGDEPLELWIVKKTTDMSDLT